MKCLRILTLAWLLASPLAASAAPPVEPPAAKPLPPIPLSLDELHAWIDRSHPLLKGAGTEKVMARGKMLKALGAFEPILVNDTELERFISSSNPEKGTQTVGFNDTLIEARHPWGFRGSAGFRQAIGDATEASQPLEPTHDLCLDGVERAINLGLRGRR